MEELKKLIDEYQIWYNKFEDTKSKDSWVRLRMAEKTY